MSRSAGTATRSSVFGSLLISCVPREGSGIDLLGVHGEAMSVATASNWLANFAVAQTFPIMLASIGRPATFWIYAGLGLLAIVFCLRLVPETKDRSLEQLETQLVEGRPAVWRAAARRSVGLGGDR